MNKAMYERVYGKPYELDARDLEILAERTALWQARANEGPYRHSGMVLRL